jgi:hypothetical protein
LAKANLILILFPLQLKLEAIQSWWQFKSGGNSNLEVEENHSQIKGFVNSKIILL